MFIESGLPSMSLLSLIAVLRLHIFGVENKYLIHKKENISLVSIFKNLFDKDAKFIASDKILKLNG